MSSLDVNFAGVDELREKMAQWGAGAGYVIQEVFDDYGAREIEQRINNILPVSGRTFAGHRKGAKTAGLGIFKHEVKGLTLTVKAPGKYGYLVFPDEGRGSSNPREQRFMVRGSEQAADKIVEQCIARLAEDL